MVLKTDMTPERNAGKHRQRSVDPSEWREWPFVKIDIFGLPLDVTTYEIHENFKAYGDLDLIVIRNDLKNPDYSKRAEIRFR